MSFKLMMGAALGALSLQGCASIGNLGASGVAERNLNRFTVGLGIAWFFSIVVLGLLTKFGVGA